MLNKKGIELGLNLVVIMIISLIVLIVVIIIFTGNTTNFMSKVKAIVADIFGGSSKEEGKCVSTTPGHVCTIYGTREQCIKEPACKWQTSKS